MEKAIKIGYCRVSTQDQNLELQKDQLTAAGCEKFYEEHASGAKGDRPELLDMIKNLREGDTVVVWRLDRLGRSLKHLLQIVEDFESEGVGFKSVTEGFDTTTNNGKLVFQIFGTLSEFERNLTRERTKAGLDAARARGRLGGRKEKLTQKQIGTMLKMYDSDDYNITEICRTFKISRPTFYRYLNISQNCQDSKA